MYKRENWIAVSSMVLRTMIWFCSAITSSTKYQEILQKFYCITMASNFPMLVNAWGSTSIINDKVPRITMSLSRHETVKFCLLN